ncbi:XdhC family protein [Halomonas sp. MES3-P3E]|uniref:XdhC family protein n=1 Tax=Halomonas sp. MES3-P3E TaxID=2058321 RepID=UPI000C3369DC|nr:XdhC family protein [Halomonas sp. MES3-P3E]PKG54227.1 XshC-Cox1 family protein [Halomonas sp. MES3-P3E]
MQYLDLQVMSRALEWARAGETLWLCTVLSTFGSSPREPGSLLVARRDGAHAGSLSGGCVEEDFLTRMQTGEFEEPVMEIRYGGDNGPQNPQISLPCGGILEVLIERLEPESGNLEHLNALHAALLGQRPQVRRIGLHDGRRELSEDSGLGPRVERDAETVRVRVGPASRLLIAGISPVSAACAEFARTLGFEVIVCDPHEELHGEIDVPGVRLEAVLPSMFIATGGCHGATAVVALTHDPRIDDLAMIEAVRTEAFYIGVMGSKRTSQARAERLRRSGGLSDEQIARLHMPIGLALGSKTPAEIALAVMADVLRVQRGKARDAL